MSQNRVCVCYRGTGLMPRPEGDVFYSPHALRRPVKSPGGDGSFINDCSKEKCKGVRVMVLFLTLMVFNVENTESEALHSFTTRLLLQQQMQRETDKNYSTVFFY